MKARPYQDEMDANIAAAVRRQFAKGNRNPSILAVLPTGGGKTFVGTRLMHRAEIKGNPSVFLTPRRELTYQAADRLRSFGVNPGIIMSGEPLNRVRLCQVASFDTIAARVMKKATMEMPPAKLVVPDEAHLTITDIRQAILDSFGEGTVTVGLTATPARADGKPLGSVYDEMVIGWPTGKMVEEGYLVGTKYFAPTEVDLKAVRTSKKTGDYSESGLETVMIKPKIIGDVVDNWFKLANYQSTVVFCVTRKHARFVTEAFVARGVKAEYVDGETPEDQRKDIFARVDSGETIVLVNVFVASYGLDIPRLTVCQLARPTKSLVLYLQMCGRVLRPIYADWATSEMLEESAEIRLAAIADSYKPYSMVIDHAGAVKRHGFLDEPMPWTLDGDESISDVKDRERAEREAPKLITCPKCKCEFKGTRFCPNCGTELIPPGEAVPTHKADLEEMVRDGNRANQKTPWAEKIRFMGEAYAYEKNKGFKEGFAANMYREKFGAWPNDPRVRNAPLSPPTDLLKGFIQHRAMKKKFGGKKSAA